MGNDVYVTGLGIISAIGYNKEENFRSLIQQKTGIHPVELLIGKGEHPFMAGEIGSTNLQLAAIAGCDQSADLPRSALLALIAAEEAINDAGISAEDPWRTGIILGNTVGGMDLTEKYYHKSPVNNTYIKSHSCGYITEQVADHLGIRGFATTISTACSSGANAIMLGARLIRHGIVDRVIAGGTDALSKFTYYGFSSLMVVDTEICRPFDKNRAGMNLGEGAGLVVLESAEAAKKRGMKPLAILSGYANANDAYHPTATSPEGNGPFLSMTSALRKAGLESSMISYINVHGTGTENNDETEATALVRVFGGEVPPFSSTKSYFGHTLGAAGGIEAVVSVLALRNQVIFPNLFFSEPMDGRQLIPVKEVLTNTPVNHVLSNSFGFGGNNTSLVFSGC
ncbi:MAG: beta-ketoacyl-[acyl-carrier-protein] synthase family protein [Bacteroidales bacterium]|nr:beta-ketoacyl-[acyl-carrier-protein] synthase family protein [Bacteroidales bacterium]